MAHANIHSIRELANKGVVYGLDLSDHTKATRDAHCEDCVKGKQHRVHMRGRPTPSKRGGEVIQSDVCGPMTVNSLGGSRYFVIFIDEHAGYVTVACIPKKSNVQLEFKWYHVWVERCHDCVAKVLHWDGSGEYQALSNYLECQGMERVMLPPYSPEQNGMAERTNRTLV